MSVYYNEVDPYAAAWLKNLIRSGDIPDGYVDKRTIRQVEPGDLSGFTQCHFFAGIGGWPYALQLADWDSDRPVWTGSCPCQPFSIAGKRAAFEDERDLWPEWRRLIRECRPPTIFGEQVAGTDGKLWFDRAAQELESDEYAVAAAVLPAFSVGAGHRRDRFFIYANAISADATGRYANRGRLPSKSDLACPWAYANWQGGNVGYVSVADGIPAKLAKRVAHGFGNAIVPQVAAEFIGAAMNLPFSSGIRT
jgi:DNA (cytosine-5)-methyltransferase 1